MASVVGGDGILVRDCGADGGEGFAWDEVAQDAGVGGGGGYVEGVGEDGGFVERVRDEEGAEGCYVA